MVLRIDVFVAVVRVDVGMSRSAAQHTASLSARALQASLLHHQHRRALQVSHVNCRPCMLLTVPARSYVKNSLYN